MKNKYKDARKASKIFANFTTFAGIVGLLESGVIYSDSDSGMAAQNIISICKKEQERLLNKYDIVLEGFLSNSTVQEPENKS